MTAATFRKVVWAGGVLPLLLGATLAGQAPALPSDAPPPGDPGGGVPDMVESSWKWDLGDLTAGMKYATTLTIENECRTTETVTISTKNLPEVMFDLPGCLLPWPDKSCTASVPPGSLDVATIIESDKAFYYVDPLAPFATPRPFRPVSGEIVVVHPRNDNCLQRRDTYAVSFNLGAMRGELPPPARGPERIAGAGFCEVWWNTGQRPPLLPPDEDCTAVIRPLAVGLRERVLPPYIQKAPGQWTWLPAAGEIGSMSSEAMVAMKVRAAALMVPE